MIKISEPWIENDEQDAYLKAKIEIPSEATKVWKEFANKSHYYTYIKENYKLEDNYIIIWYKVKKNLEKYLCEDRNDAFLVAILYYAMITGQDIECGKKISDKLLFNLNYILIPTLCNEQTGFKRIYIKADTTNKIYNEEKKVATGMSNGIDSLYTLHSLKEKYINRNYKLNALTFINAGASHYFPKLPKEIDMTEINEKANELHRKKCDKAREIAKIEKLDLVEIHSNISDLYQGVFGLTHIYRNLSCILAMQKFFGKYYYSSAGLKIDEYKPSLLEDGGHMELMLIPILSTENLEFICGGESRTRYMKTKELTEDAIAQNYLNVCGKDENCANCAKCYRTILTLEQLGKLESFKNVFNLNNYNRTRAYFWLLNNKDTDEFASEIYSNIKNKKIIPLKSRLLSLIYKMLKKLRIKK